MSLHERAKHLILSHKISLCKSLGQNFMVDSAALHLLASHADLSESDVVLDIGAGLGFLTRSIAQKSKAVLAVEKDRRLVKILKTELGGFHNVILIQGNILEVSTPPFNKIVANPPFSISSKLVLWLLSKQFEVAIISLQKDFAKRLIVEPGSREYGPLTVLTNYGAEVELLETISKDAFYPPPKVEIIVVKWTPKIPPRFKVENEIVFKDVVQTLFTQRNRKLRNAVKQLLKNYERSSIDSGIAIQDKRVRELLPEDFGVLANELA